MPIGSLGDIVFEISEKQIRTFSKMSLSAGARYSTHNRINGSPILEYTGAELKSVSLTIVLSAFQGIYPRKEMNKINKACEDGKPLRLVIGNAQLGKYKWVIKSADSELENIDNKGRIYKITVKLTLTEYVKR